MLRGEEAVGLKLGPRRRVKARHEGLEQGTEVTKERDKGRAARRGRTDHQGPEPHACTLSRDYLME